VPSDPDREISSISLKKIPLTVTLVREYDLFSDFLVEFGAHIYPEGLFVPTPRPRPKGSLIKLDFRLKDGQRILAATCQVVRCDEALPGALSGMWVSFKVIDDASRELIGKIHHERESSAGRELTPTPSPGPRGKGSKP
jgi:hypothetical protein